MRSASGCAAWCFQSLTQACGLARKAGSIERAVPSAVAGSIVHAVTSTPMPMMSAGSTAASRMTAGTAVLSTSR